MCADRLVPAEKEVLQVLVRHGTEVAWGRGVREAVFELVPAVHEAV